MSTTTADQYPYLQPCGCSLEGRCEQHAAMMKAIHAAVWQPTSSQPLARRVYALSDGYGVPGLVPPQGYDWSGIRDSTPEAIEAMHAALPKRLQVQR